MIWLLLWFLIWPNHIIDYSQPQQQQQSIESNNDEKNNEISSSKQQEEEDHEEEEKEKEISYQEYQSQLEEKRMSEFGNWLEDEEEDLPDELKLRVEESWNFFFT